MKKQVKDAGFPELTDEENGIIQVARERGFASYWPALPSAAAQAKNTLDGARAWLRASPDECWPCANGEAHEHNDSRARTASGD